jgi:hypothetical protein
MAFTAVTQPVHEPATVLSPFRFQTVAIASPFFHHRFSSNSLRGKELLH